MKRNISLSYAVQVILAFMALVFAVSGDISNNFTYASQAFVGLTFLIISYNYYTIMHKMREALIFLILGIAIMTMVLVAVL